jgi:hypothetical protein
MLILDIHASRRERIGIAIDFWDENSFLESNMTKIFWVLPLDLWYLRNSS